MPFKKGKPKTGGRVKGQPNNASKDLKLFLADLKDDDELAERWNYFWNHKNPMLRWKAFELYHHYRFGKPVQMVVGQEEAPPININVSAIPQFRVPV